MGETIDIKMMDFSDNLDMVKIANKIVVYITPVPDPVINMIARQRKKLQIKNCLDTFSFK